MTIYEEAFKLYHWTCVWPDCWLPAELIHHEPPKSLQGETLEALCPLCKDHHLYAHRHRQEAKDKIPLGKQAVIEFFSDDSCSL